MSQSQFDETLLNFGAVDQVDDPDAKCNEILSDLNNDLFDDKGKVKWGFVLLKIGVIIGRITYMILLKRIR